MGKWPSKDSFMSTLGKSVTATQLTSTSAQRVHPKHREVNIVWVEEDEPEPAPQVCKQGSDEAFD